MMVVKLGKEIINENANNFATSPLKQSAFLMNNYQRQSSDERILINKSIIGSR